MDDIRCPYCVEANGFKLMTKSSGGVWYKCDRCGHIVMPVNEVFQCPCLKCYELEHPSRKPLTHR